MQEDLEVNAEQDDLVSKRVISAQEAADALGVGLDVIEELANEGTLSRVEAIETESFRELLREVRRVEAEAEARSASEIEEDEEPQRDDAPTGSKLSELSDRELLSLLRRRGNYITAREWSEIMDSGRGPYVVRHESDGEVSYHAFGSPAVDPLDAHVKSRAIAVQVAAKSGAAGKLLGMTATAVSLRDELRSRGL